MWCEVADDPVVVLKFRPVKAGDSVEEKTGTIWHKVVRGCHESKAMRVAKG
jgi:hypothetical protein